MLSYFRLQDAVEILERMTKDNVGFKRQDTFVALGMILVQESDASTCALYIKLIILFLCSMLFYE